MNKKIMLGALALSATAVLGLTGCGGKDNDKKPETVKYTVTFDHDNDSTTQNQVVEFEKGTTALDKSVIPQAPEVDGFAGQWDEFALNDQNITVTARYGDGTQYNPYLVATSAQFKKILDEYTQYLSETYLDEHSMTTDNENQAVIKYVNYKTVTIVYTRSSTSEDWKLDRYETNKVYFKLINDINLSEIAADLQGINLSGRYFAGEIDGLIDNTKLSTENNRYTLQGLDGVLFTTSSGAMFDNVVNTSFKNLNIRLGGSLGSLVGVIRGGENWFNNITVNNEGLTVMASGDNNESAFVHHILGDDTIANFNACINNANIVSYAAYSGIFVGGYATSGTTVNFNACINTGTFTSSGKVGIFFGNDYRKPTYTITNCAHNGRIIAGEGSNVLVPNVSGSAYTSQEKVAYNSNVEGQMDGLGNSSFVPITSQNSATITGADIEVGGTNVRAGEYKLILSAYAKNSKEETILTNIVIKQEKVNADDLSVKFEDVYYGMMDITTYIASSLTNKINVDTINTDAWVWLEGYNIRYFKDETNGLYVIDYSAYDETYTINASAESLQKSIVYTGSETIEFIVDFNNN